MRSGRCVLVALMLFVVACGSTGSPEPASVVDAEPEAPPPPYHVYVTNERGGDLTVIAGETHDGARQELIPPVTNGVAESLDVHFS